MERPRKKGARFTGVDIMADEVVEEVSLNFEEKRDRCMF
jgi:pre-mRNA-processing factor SLU7